MKSFRRIFVLGALLAAATSAQAIDIGIASGQKGSTSHEMVSDVASICTAPRINVITSEGSLDNIARIAGDKAVQMGYSQEDALIYQQGNDPKMMSNIKMVFPLYTAELHIVVAANSKIRSINDLVGKRVIESEEGTGTWVTAQVIKSTTGINWLPLNMSKKASIKAIQSGAADAALFVEGRPISSLQGVTGIRLIPLSHPRLDGFKYYTKAIIPSGSYAFQQGSVPTYKVNVGLMTYGFKNQYQKEIGDMVSCITRNMTTLQQNGHAKWRDVDPTDLDSIQWPVHPAALNAVKRAR